MKYTRVQITSDNFTVTWNQDTYPTRKRTRSGNGLSFIKRGLEPITGSM